MHTVRPGESLWSIAVDALGADAPEAQVARAVELLWRANQLRIASGDPDLLAVGARLWIPEALQKESRR